MVKTLGRRIAELREKANLSQQEVADSIGLTRPHLSRIENDEVATPHRSTVRKIAKALGLEDEDELLSYLPDAGPRKRRQRPDPKPDASPDTAAWMAKEVEYLRNQVKDLKEDKGRLVEQNSDLLIEVKELRKKSTGDPDQLGPAPQSTPPRKPKGTRAQAPIGFNYQLRASRRRRPNQGVQVTTEVTTS